MRSKTGLTQAKGVIKSNVKAKQALPGLTKDAGSFLKQRQNMKGRELRHGSGGGAVTNGTAPSNIGALQADALHRHGEFERHTSTPASSSCGAKEATSTMSTNYGREAENTRKKFYTELRRVLSSADVIIEVLDARDPAACRNEELEREVGHAGKKLVLLLNKIDLIPKSAVEAWQHHLQRSFPAIAFKAAHGSVRRPTHAMTSVANAPDGLLQSMHAVVGADELMQLLKNYARTAGSKRKGHVSVGVVGYPNTGKSSVINSMKRHSAVETGGRAGVTKTMQEVQLDSKVTLIDSPGVVFEGSSDDPSVILRNVVRIENVADPIGVVEALIAKSPRAALLQYYGMQRDFALPNEFLIHVAQTRGKLQRGRGLDLQSAAKSVISDWTTGKFRYYVLPPMTAAVDAAMEEMDEAAVVSTFAPQLDVDALLNGQGDMPAVLDTPREQTGDGDVAMDSCGAATVEVDMVARAA